MAALWKLLAAYLLLAIALNLANSLIYSPQRFDYSRPLFLSAVTFIGQWAIAYCLISTLKEQPLGKERSWFEAITDWLAVNVPCAVFAALDIGLSNGALRFVSLTQYVMIKSASPVVIYAVSVVMGLQTPRPDAITSILMIVGGTGMAVYPASDGRSAGRGDALGIAMVIGATLATGVRWSLTQKHVSTLHRHGSNGPLGSILNLSLPIALLLLAASAHFEGANSPLVKQDLGLTLFVVVAASLWTFALIWVEYAMVHRASAVTLSIAGIGKELVLIFLGVFVFEDHRLEMINAVGVAVSAVGILVHSVQAARRKDSGGDGAATAFAADEFLGVASPSAVLPIRPSRERLLGGDLEAEEDAWLEDLISRPVSVVYDAIASTGSSRRPSRMFWSNPSSPRKRV